MTIASETTKHVYNGDGTTTEWPYTFQLLGTDTSTIHVYLCSPTGVITETAQFTVDTANLKVKYPSVASKLSPLASGWKIVLLRHEPVTQTLDLKNQGTFNAEAIEAELDKLTMICQQLGEALGRTVQYTLTDDVTNPTTTKFLSDCQAAQDAAEASAAAASSSASSASSSASSASTSAGTATTKAAEAAASAEAAAESAASVDVHLNANQTFTGINTFNATAIFNADGVFTDSLRIAKNGVSVALNWDLDDGAQLYTYTAPDKVWYLGNLQIMPADPGNNSYYGRVGINTVGQVVPAYSLDVVSYHYKEDTLIAARSYNKAAGYVIRRNNAESSKWYYDGTNTFLDYTGSLKFRAGVGGTEKAIIDASGNVGIGTTSPTVALDVVGAIKTSKGIVGNNTATQYGVGYTGEYSEQSNYFTNWLSTSVASGTVYQTIKTNAGTDMTVTLSSGIWNVFLNVSVWNGNSATNIYSLGVGLSTDSGFSTFSDMVELGGSGSNLTYIPCFDLTQAREGLTGGAFSRVYAVSSSTTIYPKMRIVSPSGVTLNVRAQLYATRIQ